MSEQALRCPFCACRDLQMVDSVYETGHFVLCLSCDACGPIGQTQEDAFARWETRCLYGEINNVTFGKISDDSKT